MKTEANSEPSHEKEGLDEVRKTGVFAIKCGLWAIIVATAFLGLTSLLVVGYYGIGFADRMRSTIGFRPPQEGIDFYLLLIVASIPLALLICCVALWKWYSQIWNKRLEDIWAHLPEERFRLSRWRPSDSEAARLDYICKLLASEKWGKQWKQYKDDKKKKNAEATKSTSAILEILETEIAKRALTTGFVVGLSRVRWFDALTIVFASFELQLHVLTRLGKRPSWRTWGVLIENCAASLFVNTYLNREEALWLNLMIKKIGMGIQAAGEMTEDVVESLDLGGNDHDGDASLDVDMDESLDVLHGDVCSAIKAGLIFSVGATATVGSVGLQQLGRAVDAIGDELLQGVIAASILQHQGMRLVAKTLGEKNSVSFFETSKGMAVSAGRILKNALRGRRQALREKRRKAVSNALPALRQGAKKPLEEFSEKVKDTRMIGKPISSMLQWLAKKIGGRQGHES